MSKELNFLKICSYNFLIFLLILSTFLLDIFLDFIEYWYYTILKPSDFNYSIEYFCKIFKTFLSVLLFLSLSLLFIFASTILDRTRERIHDRINFACSDRMKNEEFNRLNFLSLQNWPQWNIFSGKNSPLFLSVWVQVLYFMLCDFTWNQTSGNIYRYIEIHSISRREAKKKKRI